MTERHEQFFSGLSWLLIALFLLFLAAAVSYFGKTGNNNVLSSTSTPSPRQPREYNVFYKSGVFGPTNIRIHVGDSVRFENDSFSAVRIVSETIAGRLQLEDFDSKVGIAPNQSFSYTFLKPGTFSYHNFSNINESGSVVVRP